jgi:general secretion pathway protein F
MVRDKVREGAALADAFAASKIEVPAFEKATIEVAERTGSLENVLVQLADFIDEHRRMRERVQQALFYPALVFVLGSCVGIFMLGFLLPRTREMMSGTPLEMPWLTSVMLVAGDAVWPWGIVALGGLFLILAGLARRVMAKHELRVKYDRRLLNMPLIGRGYRLLAAIRFSRTLSILVRSGVPLVDGIVLAGRSTGSVLIEDMARKESESIRHGLSLSEAMRNIEPLSDLLSGWAEVGETGGNLPDMMSRASERSAAAFDRYLSRSLVLIEPLMLLLIGGFVLLIVLSVMLPLFSLSSAIAH